MPDIQPAVDALVTGITSFLGQPSGRLEYIVFWSIGSFDVAVQKDHGPHVWLSSRWRPSGQLFAGIAITSYPVGKARISNLKGNTPTLWIDHSARRLEFVGDRVGKVIACVHACAVEAGVVSQQPPSPSKEPPPARTDGSATIG